MKKKYIHLNLLIATLLPCLLFTQACRKADAIAQHGAVVGAQVKATTATASTGSLQVFTLAGNGTTTVLGAPTGVATDAAGNTYVAEGGNNRIRKIDPGGNISIFAGGGAAALVDGQGQFASFNAPAGLAIDAAGNVFVADKGNNCIRKITPDGLVSTIAGTSNADYVDGAISAARFNSPSGVAVDTIGNNILVADTKNQCLRVISLNNNQVLTLAGKFNQPDTIGGTIGAQGSTRFKYPFGITIDAFSNILVTDSNSVRKIANGITITLAGGGTAGFNDATGAAARFNGPAGIITDAAGNAYVADRGNNRIRVVTSAGITTTFTGSTASFKDGVPSVALFSSPAGISIDHAGSFFVADQGNNRIREITVTIVVSTLAGNGSQGYVDGTGSAARFLFPVGVVTDAAGNVYVSDFNNHIRKITPAGVVSTFSGIGSGYADGPASSARFLGAAGLCMDAAGNIYVADGSNNRIRKIDPTGYVTTVAGDGNAGTFNGAPGIGELYHPQDVAVNADGIIYVTDGAGIRKITPDGYLSTLAAIGASGLALDNAGNIYTTVVQGGYIGAGLFKVTPAGVVSRINVNTFFNTVGFPAGMIMDGSGNLYLSQAFSNTILKVTPTGTTTILAGNYVPGFIDGVGSIAEFNYTMGIAMDPNGIIYVADNENNCIRKLQ